MDAILPNAQSAHLDSDAAFWNALEATNHSLEPAGLYLTHLFEESQVILRPTWLEHLVPIPCPRCGTCAFSVPTLSISCSQK